MNLNEAIDAMVQHQNDNPHHGPDCACKDTFVVAARRAFYDGADRATRRERAWNLSLLAKRLADVGSYLPEPVEEARS